MIEIPSDLKDSANPIEERETSKPRSEEPNVESDAELEEEVNFQINVVEDLFCTDPEFDKHALDSDVEDDDEEEFTQSRLSNKKSRYSKRAEPDPLQKNSAEEEENLSVMKEFEEFLRTIKYASNAFLATKITFINEIANLCEKTDIDVEDISIGIGLDKRIGSRFLRAGPAYGGSCFPKDTKAIVTTADKLYQLLNLFAFCFADCRI